MKKSIFPWLPVLSILKIGRNKIHVENHLQQRQELHDPSLSHNIMLSATSYITIRWVHQLLTFNNWTHYHKTSINWPQTLTLLIISNTNDTDYRREPDPNMMHVLKLQISEAYKITTITVILKPSKPSPINIVLGWAALNSFRTPSQRIQSN